MEQQYLRDRDLLVAFFEWLARNHEDAVYFLVGMNEIRGLVEQFMEVHGPHALGADSPTS